jgi:competence protein ComEA
VSNAEFKILDFNNCRFVNTASADELMNLKGIGEKKANAIIEFRKANGLFKQPEDLTNVPGIGPKTLEANKDRIVVE